MKMSPYYKEGDGSSIKMFFPSRRHLNGVVVAAFTQKALSISSRFASFRWRLNRFVGTVPEATS